MSESAGRSNSIGYLMLLVGLLLVIVGWSVVLTGSASSTDVFLAMMLVQVVGIVLVLYGWKVVADPGRTKVPSPPHYNEFSVVCERCESPLPPGAESCPRCGNRIDWD